MKRVSRNSKILILVLWIGVLTVINLLLVITSR